jgi:hypothetical protein
LREGWNGGGPNTDIFFPNVDSPPLRMNLTALEKNALVAFLHTLTDEQLITLPMYSNPFVLAENQ